MDSTVTLVDEYFGFRQRWVRTGWSDMIEYKILPRSWSPFAVVLRCQLKTCRRSCVFLSDSMMRTNSRSRIPPGTALGSCLADTKSGKLQALSEKTVVNGMYPRCTSNVHYLKSIGTMLHGRDIF